jgi:F0F1-type ATP synthase gamma subunit
MGHIKNVAFADAQALAEDVIARFDGGEFDVAHLFFAKFQSALTQEPTEQQIIPVAIPVTAEPDRPAALRPRSNMSPTRNRSSPTCCRATSRCSSSVRCWKMRRPSRAAA